MYQYGPSAAEQFGKMSKRVNKGVNFANALANLSAHHTSEIQASAKSGLMDQAGRVADAGAKINPAQLMTDWVDYWLDAGQRMVLFTDLLRQRGNQYIAHEEAGAPPVLAFDYEMLVDGRKMDRPVNYALVRIVPPADVTIDQDARPYVIIDPRAGHGSGIGGSKPESQVGMALKGGHAVYFVIFFQKPEPGQTILDVTRAEQEFMRYVRSLHPNASKPVVIGNCQGGWATMMLASTSPEDTGPIVMNGAPLSYWAGENGKNPMRYVGGLAGGSWPALLMADLGNGKFDGANLVNNFESLNPANTYWAKYYNVYANVDTEGPRFLEFEKWWGGFFFMNDEEIAWIVDNLFVGNKFAQGRLSSSAHDHFDMRSIRSPIIVFASAGDNITPPQQALNWIADNYADVREIKARGQTIVYLMHQSIGHLGIFVSASIARREHKEIVSSLQSVENLRPGLYEMVISDLQGEGSDAQFKVAFEERAIDDILAMDDGRDDERPFEVVNRISKINSELYKTVVRPFVRAVNTDQFAEAYHNSHPLRTRRVAVSDKNPVVAAMAPMAEFVRENRKPVKQDNVFLMGQELFSDAMKFNLNMYRDIRDTSLELCFHMAYGLLDQLYEADQSEEDYGPKAASDDELRALPEVRAVLADLEVGGLAEGIVRMMILMAQSRGGVRRSRLERANEVLSDREPFAAMSDEARNRLIHAQSTMVEFEQDRALATLPMLLRTNEDRVKAFEMIEYVAGPAADMAEATREMLAELKDVLSVEAAAPAAPVPAKPAARKPAARRSPAAAKKTTSE